MDFRALDRQRHSRIAAVRTGIGEEVSEISAETYGSAGKWMKGV